MRLAIGKSSLALDDALDVALQRKPYDGFDVDAAGRRRIEGAQALLAELLEKQIPIYGVTTGFGDSSRFGIDPSQSEALQRNLVAYLQCGSGPLLPRPAVRAMCLARLVSVARGYSGVSFDLIERLSALLEHDLMPNVPSEGSLGASGDLVPLAYLADVVQGNGTVSTREGDRPTPSAFKDRKLAPYTLKAKEGLALVNGTSAMTGMAMVCYAEVRAILELAEVNTAWLCLALGGKPDSFGALVNEQAKLHEGQAAAARRIRTLLEAERYTPPPQTSDATRVQDRYSLRCAPQILGPVHDTLAQVADWLERELNSVSDNPLLDADTKTMATGGNFYGGYLGHGMDYLKIGVASVVDMLDRQLMLAFDPRTANGLPPNLAAWPSLPAHERHLHHGLKGLHQVVNALTSEVCSMSMPATVFSRSSECHNQDKVSLGMTAAVGLERMLDKTFTVLSLSLACLAQALDLRGVELGGDVSRRLYAKVRHAVPFTTHDAPLGPRIAALAATLKHDGLATRSLW